MHELPFAGTRCGSIILRTTLKEHVLRLLRFAALTWTMGLLAAMLLGAGLFAARTLVLPQISETPRVVAVNPAEGAANVPPRAGFTLRFNTPMNRRSVEQALTLSPPTAAALGWDAAAMTLTISPTATLLPDTEYRITLNETALGRLYRPINGPFDARFRTAPAPALVAVSPTDGATSVPLDTPIALRFSRPIASPAALFQPATLPALRFEPPVAGRVTWLDQATALFRPNVPLRPATRYQVTLDARLTDLTGGALGRSYSWSFATPAPRVLAAAPATGERLDGPRATLTLTISQRLDLAAARAALLITPPIRGTLAETLLPDGAQVLQFTPVEEWQPGITYRAELPAGLPPADGNLPLAAPFRWSVAAAPRPALVARFPGEGQTLPSGQDIRLVFSTPMDADRVRDALRFDPPALNPRVVAVGAEVRISADLRAATPYTLTLDATLADRAGVPLGTDLRLRLQAAPAAPALTLPEARERVVRLPPAAPAALVVRRTNLSSLSFALYRLDGETVVRTAGFSQAEWTTFQPERYGQPLLRTWTVPLSDTLNATTEDRLSIAAVEGQPLDPGAYYVRVQSLEGVRVDALVLISRTRLALHAVGDDHVVWATDVISATPLAGLPVALYQDGALVREGVTDAAGLWRVGPVTGQRPLLAFARGPEPAITSSARAAPGVPAYRLFLATDRASYHPGERVALGGFVRRVDGTRVTDTSGLRLSLVARHNGERLAGSITLRAGGTFEGELSLPPAAAPGTYTLTVALDGATATTTVVVMPHDPPLHVQLLAPETPEAGTAVEVRTPDGLPVAGAVVTWTLSAERELLTTRDGYRFDDDEAPPEPIPSQSGVSLTDAGGRIMLPPPALDNDLPSLRRERLELAVAELGGPEATAVLQITRPVAQVYAGMRLARRLVLAGAPAEIELIALAEGQPAPQARLQVEVLRRVWERVPIGATGAVQLVVREERVRVQELRAGDDGLARLNLPLAAGEYRVRVGIVGGPFSAAETLFVTQPGFVGGRGALGLPLLVADQDVYQLGDTASLLLLAPIRQAPTLVTTTRAGGLTSEVRELRAGEPITVTITASDAPSARVTVLSYDPAEPAEPLIAETELVVGGSPALDVALSSDATSYLPGATATLTITTATGGQLVPAALIVRATIGEARTLFWNASLRSGANGSLTFGVPLPDETGTLRVVVWAADNQRFGQREVVLPVIRPVEALLDTPAFLRAGDESEITVTLTNTTPVTRELAAEVALEGLALRDGAPAEPRLVLNLGSVGRIVWPVAAGTDATDGAARVTVRDSAGELVVVRRNLPILPDSPPDRNEPGPVALLREYLDPLSGAVLGDGALQQGRLVRVRLTVVTAWPASLQIEESLPAGAALVSAGAGVLTPGERHADRLVFSVAGLAPGAHQHTYLVRFTAAGRFSAPPPVARGQDGTLLGVGNHSTLVVSR